MSYGVAPELPEGFEGAVLHGLNAKNIRDEYSRWHPTRMWKHAEGMDRIVGETHASFPSRSAVLVDLEMPGDDLLLWLKSPAEWWPLCESLRNTKRYLRVRLPAGTGAVSLFKQVVKRFRYTHFWIDPFIHGPAPGWQGHVRLAEHENVWLSTLGLFPGEGARWSAREASEAMNFLVGEVGAGRLIYASGLEWESVSLGVDKPFREWIEQQPELEDPERPLVLNRNAAAFLHVPQEEIELL
ncbi:MAG: hypothetical protein KIS92_08275 [Planctomycetota bacterium]|nr:hypothetical protein [Planctomycetota bacterium]